MTVGNSRQTQDLDLTETVAAIAAGTLTSVQAVGDSLDRIDASQATLNAFKIVRRDKALAEAEAADERVRAGERLPLLGVPIAVKDDTDVAGAPTAFGRVGDFPVKLQDAEVVRRLRAAGAIIVGKTNACEIGQWPFTSGPGFGYTRNPWSAEHTPGGSSGGSSAAVAGSLIPAAIGSDGAGSIRIPAAWTNLFGIKPQRGRISTWPEAESFYGLTVNGPLTRTVADAALLFDVAAGNHEGDKHKPRPVTVSDAVGRDPGVLRIALSYRRPFTGVKTSLHPEVQAGVERVVTALRSLGHHVEIADPVYGPQIGASFMPRSMAGIDNWTRDVPDPSKLDPHTVANARLGKVLRNGPLQVVTALEPLLHKQVGRIYDTFDVVIAPSTGTPPPALHAPDGLSSWGLDKLITNACPYAWPWNVLGWPSVAIPGGFTSDGLPVGAQLMGNANAEPLLVSLAAQLESVLRWDLQRPEPWWLN